MTASFMGCSLAGPTTPVLCPQSFENRFDFHIGKTHEGGPNERRVSSSVFRHSQLCAQEKIKGLPHSRPNLIPAALPWVLRGSMQR